ncbi:uncharacterized protein LOC121070861 isoform X4 [Cygnus olor]|uniref:uncharacterized protein LOC121070861 isoform X4 n=1 Tax=Cygnus olor TaxID=8869 RepID=UPI001ADE58FF|nr:uncharacterized protein LOC121070861 isoform X4 [Cygnus olor]
MLLRLVLLFQPESHSDGTRPRHTPGLTALDHSAGRKSCQRSPGQVRSPQPTPYHALTASSQVTRSGQDGSDRSIRTTGHGQPRQNHTAMGPDHGTILASLPFRTQLENLPTLSRTGKIAPTHTHHALTASSQVTRSDQDGSDRSIRTTGHGQPRQNHTAMGPDHGTILASLPFRTQLENLPTLSRTGKIAPTHTHHALTASSQVTRSDQDSSDRSIRTTGHGQPRQNHTAMGPDHGTLLASLPSTTQLEGRAANALQDR